MLVALGPVAVTDLRAETLPQVFLSDASSTWSSVFVLKRHCRGTTEALLSSGNLESASHTLEGLSEHDELEGCDEVPAGVPLVCHPLWVSLAEHLQFKLYDSKEIRKRRHNDLLEVPAILDIEKKLAERHFSGRYLAGADSQVALASVVQGRSSSYGSTLCCLKALPPT